MSKYFGKCFGPSTLAPEPSFWLRCPSFCFKICFTIKVNSVCGTGQDTWNLRRKFNSQGLALRILGLRVAISKSQGPISKVIGIRVPCPSSRALGVRVSGSRISGPDFRLCCIIYLKDTIEKNWCSQNFDFLSLKNSSPGQLLGSFNSHIYHWFLNLVAT